MLVKNNSFPDCYECLNGTLKLLREQCLLWTPSDAPDRPIIAQGIAHKLARVAPAACEAPPGPVTIAPPPIIE